MATTTASADTIVTLNAIKARQQTTWAAGDFGIIGTTLQIVGESLAGRLTAFSIQPDGSLADRRVWAETWPYIPDGICLDAEGAIWIANPVGPQCVNEGPRR